MARLIEEANQRGCDKTENVTSSISGEQLGVSQPTVVNDLSRNEGIPEKADKPKRIQYTMTQY